MWWGSQNLEKPVKAKDGRIWHFRVWHGGVDSGYAQRIFFWDDARKDTGCAEFANDQTLHVSKIKQRMRKIITNPKYRDQFRTELKFPVERHYS